MSEAPVQVPTGQRQLFLDDRDVAEIHNLTRTMHQPEKKGAVIRGDYLHYGGCSLQTRSAPIWDPQEQVYKLWVMGVAPPPEQGLSVTDSFSGYYESKDGLNWSTPVVNQVEYRGSKQNNFVTARIGGKWSRTDCVVYDPTDPDPNRRYKLAVPDVWHGCSWHTQCGGGFAVSSDGIRWTETKSPGVPSYDEWSLSFDEREGLFIHYVKFSDPNGRRSIYVSTSKDFQNWTEPQLVFWADEQDQALAPKRIAQRMADGTRKVPEYNVPETYRVEVYHMGIFRYESHYIGTPAMSYHTGSVPKEWPGFEEMHLSPEIDKAVHTYGDYTWFYELQLASSRDLYHWQRLGDRKPWLENSPLGGGAYDLQTIIGPADVVVCGDELRFYYTGIKAYAFITSGDVPGYDDYYPDKGGICLAVLRRDGFVSLDAGEEEGTLRTRPFILPKGELHLNVSAPQGYVVVQVCDEHGKAIPGYETSGAVQDDQLDAVVGWPDARLEDLAGRPVCLRIALRQARLYAYWIES